MFPYVTTMDAAHMRLRDLICFTDFFLGDNSQVGQVSYLKNLIVSKFAQRLFHSFAIMPSTMSCFIKHVFAMGAPDKIFEKAISGVSVKVPTLHARGARSDERFKNESINAAVKMPVVYGQGYRRTISRKAWAKSFVREWFQNIFCASNFPGYGTSYNLYMPIRPHATLIGNIISGEVGDWFPIFFGDVKILVSHVSNLRERFLAWLEPYSCDNRSAACSFIST